MGENPIQKVLREASEQDARRQQQVQHQIQVINRLLEKDNDGAVQESLRALDRATDFILSHGLWDAYQREVLDAPSVQPQDPNQT